MWMNGDDFKIEALLTWWLFSKSCCWPFASINATPQYAWVAASCPSTFHTERMRDNFIAAQNAIEAIDRAIARETLGRGRFPSLVTGF
jgi:hypothetical protein